MRNKSQLRKKIQEREQKLHEEAFNKAYNVNEEYLYEYGKLLKGRQVGETPTGKGLLEKY